MSEEEFIESKLTDLEFEQGDEEQGSITYRSFVSFKYSGIDYEMGVDVTYSWSEESPPEYDFDFLDDIPEELEWVWDEIQDKLEEFIKAEDRKKK